MTAALQTLVSEVRWRPGIGDPDAVGWLVTFAYVAAAALCLLCAFKAQREEPATRESSVRLIWSGLGLLLLLLGLNKQLDLQTLLVDLGRSISQHGGWYDRRQPIKVAFDLALAATGLAGLVLGARWIPRRIQNFRLVFAGLGLILTYAVVRAAPLHWAESAPHSPFWPVEFVGVGLVGLAAARTARAGTLPARRG